MALKKLTIPCYYETDEVISFEKQGIETTVEQLVIYDITIYEKPFAISPHTDKDKIIGTSIYVGNEHYISTLKVEEVDILIEATWGE